VQFSMAATFGTKDPTRDKQVITVTPPWPSGQPIQLTVTNGLCTVSEVIARDINSPEMPLTGVYVLHSQTPYNPLKEGIKGFDSDLGVLVHSITIEVVSTSTKSLSENLRPDRAGRLQFAGGRAGASCSHGALSPCLAAGGFSDRL
jgi:hypothetical protein